MESDTKPTTIAPSPPPPEDTSNLSTKIKKYDVIRGTFSNTLEGSERSVPRWSFNAINDDGSNQAITIQMNKICMPICHVYEYTIEGIWILNPTYGFDEEDHRSNSIFYCNDITRITLKPFTKKMAVLLFNPIINKCPSLKLLLTLNPGNISITMNRCLYDIVKLDYYRDIEEFINTTDARFYIFSKYYLMLYKLSNYDHIVFTLTAKDLMTWFIPAFSKQVTRKEMIRFLNNPFISIDQDMYRQGELGEIDRTYEFIHWFMELVQINGTIMITTEEMEIFMKQYPKEIETLKDEEFILCNDVGLFTLSIFQDEINKFEKIVESMSMTRRIDDLFHMDKIDDAIKLVCEYYKFKKKSLVYEGLINNINGVRQGLVTIKQFNISVLYCNEFYANNLICALDSIMVDKDNLHVISDFRYDAIKKIGGKTHLTFDTFETKTGKEVVVINKSHLYSLSDVIIPFIDRLHRRKPLPARIVFLSNESIETRLLTTNYLPLSTMKCVKLHRAPTVFPKVKPLHKFVMYTRRHKQILVFPEITSNTIENKIAAIKHVSSKLSSSSSLLVVLQYRNDREWYRMNKVAEECKEDKKMGVGYIRVLHPFKTFKTNEVLQVYRFKKDNKVQLKSLYCDDQTVLSLSEYHAKCEPVNCCYHDKLHTLHYKPDYILFFGDNIFPLKKTMSLFDKCNYGVFLYGMNNERVNSFYTV